MHEMQAIKHLESNLSGVQLGQRTVEVSLQITILEVLHSDEDGAFDLVPSVRFDESSFILFIMSACCEQVWKTCDWTEPLPFVETRIAVLLPIHGRDQCLLSWLETYRSLSPLEALPQNGHHYTAPTRLHHMIPNQ